MGGGFINRRRGLYLGKGGPYLGGGYQQKEGSISGTEAYELVVGLISARGL